MSGNQIPCRHCRSLSPHHRTRDRADRDEERFFRLTISKYQEKDWCTRCPRVFRGRVIILPGPDWHLPYRDLVGYVPQAKCAALLKSRILGFEILVQNFA